MKKYALLISCCGNSSKEKMHDSELRKLRGVLEEAGYEGIFCPSFDSLSAGPEFFMLRLSKNSTENYEC